MVDYIIAKLPQTWTNFATFLKHKRQEFGIADLIGYLDVEENVRSKYVHRAILQSKYIPLIMTEREMCPWAISISILVIRCTTHYLSTNVLKV
jgi:hypothetical protein